MIYIDVHFVRPFPYGHPVQFCGKKGMEERNVAEIERGREGRGGTEKEIRELRLVMVSTRGRAHCRTDGARDEGRCWL